MEQSEELKLEYGKLLDSILSAQQIRRAGVVDPASGTYFDKKRPDVSHAPDEAVSRLYEHAASMSRELVSMGFTGVHFDGTINAVALYSAGKIFVASFVPDPLSNSDIIKQHVRQAVKDFKG